MALTYTSTANMLAVPRSVHIGVNHLEFDFNSGAGKFGSLSDVLLIGKLPNGAKILDVALQFGVSTAGAIHYTLLALVQDTPGGTYSTFATIYGSMTASLTAATFRSVTPYKVSLSDDRAVKHITLALNCTTGASGTVSQSIQGLFLYATDGVA